MDILVIERLSVDALSRRCDPAGDLATVVYRSHQGAHVHPVDVGRQPLTLAPRPFLGRYPFAVGTRFDGCECTDLAIEGDVRQPQPHRQAGALEDLVPPVDTVLAVVDVLPTQVRIEAYQRRHLGLADLAVLGNRVNQDGVIGQPVVV